MAPKTHVIETLTGPKQYISCADTAKMIREELKFNWPGVKFSVTSKTYSGGASISIHWTDGPRPKQVEQATRYFEGADFDGMQDLKTYKEATLNGERVHFGADFIFTDRATTRPFLAKVAEKVATKYGMTMPNIVDATSWKTGKPTGTAYLDDKDPATFARQNDWNRHDFRSLVWQELGETNA